MGTINVSMARLVDAMASLVRSGSLSAVALELLHF